MHRIVLVDDDCDDRELFASTFRLVSDACLAPCASVAEALEMFSDRTTTGEYHRPLVITDLNMPKADGFELITKLRADPTTTPVIVVLSTSASLRDITRAYRSGCNAYHVKPMGFDETKELAQQIVSYWQPLLELS